MERITMDFVLKLSITTKGYHHLGYVDRLIKSAHFILLYSTYSMDRYARVKLHGVPPSYLSFEKAYIRFWKYNYLLIYLIILKLTDNQRNQYKYWKIC